MVAAWRAATSELRLLLVVDDARSAANEAVTPDPGAAGHQGAVCGLYRDRPGLAASDHFVHGLVDVPALPP